MPTQYGMGKGDGYAYHSNTTDWATSRDATSATVSAHNGVNYAYAVRERSWAGRGGGAQRFVGRSFFAFDTSGISSAPSSASLKIKGIANGTCDFFVVKSTHTSTGGGLADADFDAITGWSAGVDNEGNVTKYSAEITSWSTSGYNTITLNSTALSDIASLSTFKVCLIGSVYDLRNVEPTANYDAKTGAYYTEYGGTGSDPYLDYTVATTVTDNSIFFGCNF